MKYILLLSLFVNVAHAWTLNNNFVAAFKDNKVKVMVAGNTICDPTKAGVTPGELEDLIEPAVDKFWNKVPTSALELKASGFSDNISNINSGRLCSPTDDTCITAGNGSPGGLIPPVRNIIIACNDNSDNFGSNSVLAVAIPNKFSGKDIVGSVVIINNFSSAFGNLSKSDKISVLAHEIGHAIGLGHSEDKAALMYYRTVNQRKYLGQDDIDGLSYLYPIHGDAYGCSKGLTDGPLGGFGILKQKETQDDKQVPPFVQMVAAFALLVLIFELRRLFYRTQTGSTT